MRIEARCCSANIQNERNAADHCGTNPVPAEVSNLIRQAMRSYVQQERDANTDHQAVRDFCILAGRALGIAKQLAADAEIEINERHQGDIVFEMQDLYLAGDTQDPVKHTLFEIAQKADCVYMDSAVRKIRLVFSYNLAVRNS